MTFTATRTRWTRCLAIHGRRVLMRFLWAATLFQARELARRSIV
jgi:hypothetical protein